MKFNQGKDTKESDKLSALVQETPWCTKTMAASQLKNGDFYVYVTIGKKGQVNPRIAIKMSGKNISEVRGILSNQNLENSMTPVLERFLESDFDKDKSKEYFEKIEFNEKAKALHKKVKGQGKWNKEDVSEMISLIQSPNKSGFGQGGGLNGFYERLGLLSKSLPGFSYFRLVDKSVRGSEESKYEVELKKLIQKEYFLADSSELVQADDDSGFEGFVEMGLNPAASDFLKLAREIYLELKDPYFNASQFYKRSPYEGTKEYIKNAIEKSKLAYQQDRLLPEALLYAKFKESGKSFSRAYSGGVYHEDFIATVFDLLDAAEKIDGESTISLSDFTFDKASIEALNVLGIFDKIFSAKKIDSITVHVDDYSENSLLSRTDLKAEIGNLSIVFSESVDNSRISERRRRLENENRQKDREARAEIARLKEAQRKVRNNRDFDDISNQIDSLENEINSREKKEKEGLNALVIVDLGDINLNLSDGATVILPAQVNMSMVPEQTMSRYSDQPRTRFKGDRSHFPLNVSVGRFTNAKKITLGIDGGRFESTKTVIRTLEGLEDVTFDSDSNKKMVVEDFGDVVTLRNFSTSLLRREGLSRFLSNPSKKLKNVFSTDLLSNISSHSQSHPEFYSSVETLVFKQFFQDIDLSSILYRNFSPSILQTFKSYLA